MYVCVCNAIRECELRRAALRCAGDAEAVYAALGKRPNCGQCLDEADSLIAEEREVAAIPFAA
jgi:bacterioferritin-associated ferredoxin